MCAITLAAATPFDDGTDRHVEAPVVAIQHDTALKWQDRLADLAQGIAGFAALVQALFIAIALKSVCLDMNLCQTTSPALDPEWARPSSALEALLLVGCTVFSLVDAFIWLVKDARRSCCLSGMDRIAATHRRSSFLLLCSVERLLHQALTHAAPDACTPWVQVEGSARGGAAECGPSKVAALTPTTNVVVGDVESPAHTDPDRGSSMPEGALKKVPRPMGSVVCMLDSIGAQIRASPIKMSVVTMNMIVITQSMGVHAPAAVALISAIATAATMTDYIRRASCGVSHADGLRME